MTDPCRFVIKNLLTRTDSSFILLLFYLHNPALNVLKMCCLWAVSVHRSSISHPFSSLQTLWHHHMLALISLSMLINMPAQQEANSLCLVSVMSSALCSTPSECTCCLNATKSRVSPTVGLTWRSFYSRHVSTDDSSTFESVAEQQNSTHHVFVFSNNVLTAGYEWWRVA